ncbi:DUF6173 family protein [Phascolarctobacterium sp.]|uniref:DUF6173 family protein n=1 Tax=Phascolarctobacterium sp. TaxID=2049039 RepID=UPI0026DD354D|nr:DUF6173 family protein [Phascolarctobacterium sp.]
MDSGQNAKEVYQTIMNDIHDAENNLAEGYDLYVFLSDYPNIEITTIGRRGDHLLFFEGCVGQSQKTHFLIHYSKVSLLIVEKKIEPAPAYKPKRKIGFVVKV